MQAATAQTTDETERSEKRLLDLVVEYTAYEWWLVRYKGNEITCRFLIDHEGLPIEDEIRTWCGDKLGTEWERTKPCDLESDETIADCPGMYLLYFESMPAKRKITVDLPLPSVYISITGCDLVAPENSCESVPNLLLTGEEPLPNETIIGIHGVLNGEPFTCNSSPCSLPLHPTGDKGETFEFWADSSFGDSSPHYTAQIRVVLRGDFMSPDGPIYDSQLYYVDILSEQWRGGTQASCSQIWNSFPDVGGPAPWLTTPDDPSGLYSAVSLYYLAGMLIANGEVDASSCQDGGLVFGDELTASECGLDVAFSDVVEWQNRFDSDIILVANDTGVPAQLLKNVFSRESQFWPGIYSTYEEAGLGQMTEKGAETILLWNPSFFSQFCPLVLHQSRCDLGYGNITIDEQTMLHGALVTEVDASCPDCPAGIDLEAAHFSVRVFAEGMIANCEQVGRILNNITGKTAGELTSYEDLWRFTLVNYNAGPGCLSKAAKRAFLLGGPLDWLNIAARLEPACKTAIDYVEDISMDLSGVEPTATSWVFVARPLRTPTPRTFPTETPTLTPTITPTYYPGQPTYTATPTPQSYPVETGYPVFPTWGYYP